MYVFSAGNGNATSNNLPTDNVNYSGLVNNRYTIPVAAVDEKGLHSYYSEIGATIVVSAPSNSKETSGITTTDLPTAKGYNSEYFKTDYINKNYTKNFGGTSASCPIVTGVVALILEANPLLGWRDIKSIVAKSARKNDIANTDWTTNGAGLSINHTYGFGIMNADKAIEMSLLWKKYPDEIVVEKEIISNIPIPDFDKNGIMSSIDLLENIQIEFVDIYVDIPDHERVGDLEISLLSPQGTKSILSEYHKERFPGFFRYTNWRFGTMRCLDEYSKGIWKLSAKDNEIDKYGTLISWKLKIYGHNK